ncbi:hypothetical protein VOLCADRAFT_117957 [Volvox carteri f. nagariensis]|uniref:2-oxoadipate dioxygenase/decarboxylase n=1 Tax=Volvox carteri f. nagariensis TaxID=3068 RepID=D8TZG9_VOLCA|nr:uncharacterized protein VOLCADRAFT_117957 [Volvox carteri f. nagariensis]EFJ47180.1 hypothetical protein VOLCADRAFT_117957 [Volvox carteri f. nagariensis]|eukprot:XP_002951729.1 hypothetical protein VOLCADRAFT_117957 [Volvox carteri f. nagariensis]
MLTPRQTASQGINGHLSNAHGHRSTTATSATRPDGQLRLPKELLIRLTDQCQVPPATLPFLHQVLELYAERTPGLHTVVEGVMRPGYMGLTPGETLGHDHFAFRTFGVPGLGISSLERILLPLGYQRVEDPGAPLTFPAKKLVATWFMAKDPRVRAVLPRVFVSEIQVEKLSPAAREIILGTTGWAAGAGEAVQVQVLTALLTGTAPWPRPTLEQYELLLKESEYAAWVLAHGYSLNHTALALHRLPGVGPSLDMDGFVRQLSGAGMAMNAEGGLVKVSPDGLLLQCSVVADRRPFEFSCGQQQDIAAAYVEFVKRLRLPRFAHLKDEELREEHLRDGFEVGNADRIFESTTLAATGAGSK